MLNHDLNINFLTVELMLDLAHWAVLIAPSGQWAVSFSRLVLTYLPRGRPCWTPTYSYSSNTVWDPRHCPGDEDLGSLGSASPDRWDWETDKGAISVDGDHDSHGQQSSSPQPVTSRRPPSPQRPSHLAHQPTSQYKPHLRVLWRHQQDWLHIHPAKERAEEVHHHLRSQGPGQSTHG